MRKPFPARSIFNFICNLFTVEQWNIGYIEKSIEELIENKTPYQTHWLLYPSRKEYYADPFPIEFKRLYVFFEKFDRALGKGSIAMLRLDQETGGNEAEQVLVKPHHLSYPFVFKYGGEIYMIPEEWVTRCITLYKCSHFPSKWEPVSILVENIEAVDASIFQFNSRLWLTFSQRKNPLASLLIYYSDSLLGPWMPHEKNPVKIDKSSARPAGRPFLYKGNVIRPAQDCRMTYGGRVVLNQIISLTPEDFEEKPIKIISPAKQSAFSKGIHTFNPIENIVIVDGKRYILSLYGLKKTLKKFMRPKLKERS